MAIRNCQGRPQKHYQRSVQYKHGVQNAIRGRIDEARHPEIVRKYIKTFRVMDNIADESHLISQRILESNRMYDWISI